MMRNDENNHVQINTKIGLKERLFQKSKSESFNLDTKRFKKSTSSNIDSGSDSMKKPEKKDNIMNNKR